MSMASVSAWIYTVKEVNTTFYSFQNIRRCSDSHQIRRFILWQMRHNCIQNPVHLLMTLSNCKSADCIAIQIQF